MQLTLPQPLAPFSHYHLNELLTAAIETWLYLTNTSPRLPRHLALSTTTQSSAACQVQT